MNNISLTKINFKYQNKSIEKQDNIKQPSNITEHSFTNSSIYSNNEKSSQIAKAFRSFTKIQDSLGYKFIRTFKTPLSSLEGTIYQLNNGHNVIILPKKGSIAVQTHVKNGSFDEPAELKGISHYIEHILAGYVEKENWKSISKNAETNITETRYHFNLPLQHADELENYFAEFADSIIKPDFSQKAVDKERPIILAEAGESPDSDSKRADKLAIKQLFNTEKVFFNTIGTEETIKNITPQKLTDYYNSRYAPNKMTTIIVGDITAQQGVELVNKYFGKQKNLNIKYEPPINNYKITNQPIRSDIVRTDPKLDRAAISINLKGFDEDNYLDRTNANVLFSTLSEKSKNRFKEFSGSLDITYSIISTEANAPNIISIDGWCDKGKEEDFLKAVYKYIEESKKIAISQYDIDSYKNDLKLSSSLCSEESELLSNSIGSNYGPNNNIQQFEDRLKTIDKISGKSLIDFANKYFDLNKASIVVTHPQEKSAEIEQKKVSFAGKSPIYETKDIKQYTLKNNIHLVIHGADNVSTAKIDFNIINKNTPKQKVGTANILRSMLRNGVDGIEKEFFKQQLKHDSIDLDASTGCRNICFSEFCRGEQATKSIEMALKQLAKPPLTQDNLDEVKKDYRKIVKIMEKYPSDFVDNEIYKNTILETTTADVFNNFENITLDDVKNLYKDLLSNSKACATIVLPKAELLNQEQSIINKLSSIPIVFKPFEYSSFETPEAITPLKTSKVFIKAKDEQPQNPDFIASISQTYKLITPNKHYDPKLSVGLSCLNNILGGSSSSRLMKDLREKQGLAYEVRSSYDYYDQLGSMTLEINTNTKEDKSNIQKAINGFKDNINKIMYWPVSDEELKLAKDSMISGIFQSYETALNLNGALNDAVYSRQGLNLINEKLKAIKEITPEYIQQLAIMLFKNQHSLFGILAPKDALKQNEEFFAKLGEVKDVTIKK
ncbi:MAG: insulinase family protein [bacterium]